MALLNQTHIHVRLPTNPLRFLRCPSAGLQDLKLDNMLLCKAPRDAGEGGGGSKMVAKIADFGLHMALDGKKITSVLRQLSTGFGGGNKSPRHSTSRPLSAGSGALPSMSGGDASMQLPSVATQPPTASMPLSAVDARDSDGRDSTGSLPNGPVSYGSQQRNVITSEDGGPARSCGPPPAPSSVHADRWEKRGSEGAPGLPHAVVATSGHRVPCKSASASHVSTLMRTSSDGPFATSPDRPPMEFRKATTDPALDSQADIKLAQFHTSENGSDGSVVLQAGRAAEPKHLRRQSNYNLILNFERPSIVSSFIKKAIANKYEVAYKMTGETGSCMYMSPEVQRCQP